MWHHRRRRGGQEHNRWCKFTPRIKTSSCVDKNTELIELKQGRRSGQSHTLNISLYTILSIIVFLPPFWVSRNKLNTWEEPITRTLEAPTRKNKKKNVGFGFWENSASSAWEQRSYFWQHFFHWHHHHVTTRKLWCGCERLAPTLSLHHSHKMISFSQNPETRTVRQKWTRLGPNVL